MTKEDLTAICKRDGLDCVIDDYVGLLEAIDDVKNNRNLYGPYNSAEEAVASMLAD